MLNFFAHYLNIYSDICYEIYLFIYEILELLSEEALGLCMMRLPEMISREMMISPHSVLTLSGQRSWS